MNVYGKYSFVAIAAFMLLEACATKPVDPASIKPVYRIQNSPIPVPHAKWNPRRGNATRTATYKEKSQANRRVVTPVVQAVAKTVRVKKGDTLYAISRKHGVPVRSLISVNGLRAPYALAVGQKLRLPGAMTHTVRKGETGYSISRKYGVTVSSLMRSNGIKPPYTLAVGQKLSLPGGAGTTVAVPATPKRGRTVALPTPPPRSKDGFVWPVKGKLASRFGPKEGGIHNDGINILAPAGAAVKASEAGIVVYASNALEGYGNLLLLKHSGGWITAYAHNERLLVRKGQKVNKGQVVARVGATGGVKSPQLHFEIRKGRQALDPLNYLGTVRSR